MRGSSIPRIHSFARSIGQTGNGYIPSGRPMKWTAVCYPPSGEIKVHQLIWPLQVRKLAQGPQACLDLAIDRHAERFTTALRVPGLAEVQSELEATEVIAGFRSRLFRELQTFGDVEWVGGIPVLTVEDER